MNSSQGLNESHFDVLHSQTKLGEDVVGDKFAKQIPIHIIGESRFGKVEQPTELNPVVEAAEEDEDVESQEKYKVPEELLKYLDELIVKKKIPLRVLKFDIQEAQSREEIAEYLTKQAEEKKNIDVADLDKLFGFIGYGREGGEDLHTAMSSEEEGESEQEELPEIESEPDVESAPVDLTNLRANYSSLYVARNQKVLNDTRVFKRLISDLGGTREMPQKADPAEYAEARREYLKARGNTRMRTNEGLDESARLRDEELAHLPESTHARLRKAVSFFDYYINATLISEGLGLADTDSIEKIIDPVSFDGMRTVKNEPESVQEQADVQLVQAETPVVQEKEPEEIKPTFVSVGESAFVPKKNESAPETTQIPPVDSSVAEALPIAQNVYPTEFESKKLEVQHGFPGNPNQIKVIYDGKEIAVGSAGDKVKINKEFNSGFLFADTLEERALKHAGTIIKTIKAVK